MRTFGRLIDGKISIVNGNIPITINGETVYTNNEQLMLEAGYKLVIYNEPPEVDEGQQIHGYWLETDKAIIRCWEKGD